MQATITRQQLGIHQRISQTAGIFGIHFPMLLEPYVFAVADGIASDYNGGYWEFYSLSNGGFYMAPASCKPFSVSCDNGFNGVLSADALGIAACMYAYSHLSFTEGVLAEICTQHYHLLREYMLEHSEVGVILKAID